MAARGKAAGKLLDISDMPNVMHGYQCDNYGKDKETKWFYEEERMAFDKWVRYAE